ncbi:MAG: DEAD/DEAH box helicase [SAR324 cluster bacterium]|uniref:DEAD/DEAH box helicase n=1 Tax=SAR324 cluster bacterium TaxID=2024889 RepID=A0A7X9IJ04_9DELT|nr:DEAD/DEAH box helicase [SAR324 cluster bacterium]
MDQNSEKKEPKLLNFMRRFAPYSTIDRGTALESSGQLHDISRLSNQINAYVDDEDGRVNRVLLKLISEESVEASCSCCSTEEMEEQWCAHAVALLIHSERTGLSNVAIASGDAGTEYQINRSTSADIAEILRELIESNNKPISNFLVPEVRIGIGFGKGTLLIRPLFNGAIPQHHKLSRGGKASPRELDNLLLRILEEEGLFDEERQLWILQDSHTIEGCLGILSEFENIFLLDNLKPLHFERQEIQAFMKVTWLSAAVDITLHWILPDGSIKYPETPVIGSSSQWTLVEQSIFSLSSSASNIAALFSHAARLVLPKSQCGPLLEILESHPKDLDPFIKVSNPLEQPKTKIATPLCRVNFELKNNPFEHFLSSQKIQIEAKLEFIYPQPKKGSNVVFLPNRLAESEAQSQLEAIGFSQVPGKKLYLISGDEALNFISDGQKDNFIGWEVNGLERIKTSLRITPLEIELRINDAQSSGKQKGIKEKIDWFECEVVTKRDGVKFPLHALFGNLRYESEAWVQLSDGAYARVPGGSMSQLKTTLGFLDSNFRLSDTIQSRLGTAQALSLCTQEQPSFKVSTTKSLDKLATRLKDFSKMKSALPSRNFKGKLRPYQKDGLSWLEFLQEFQFGGILADEMGLGKTVQTLALLQRLKENQKKGILPKFPNLVVAPTSVTTNWIYEAQRFTPNLKVLLLQGAKRREYMERLDEYDIVITSYTLLRLDRHLLEGFEFYYMILDEAQNIKNHQAATTRAAKAIKAHRRLALSGTPTENRPLELWSIFDFLMPGYLGNQEFFRNWIEKPILEHGTSTPVTKLLNSRTRPFILRRFKSEVEKDLPPKIETTLHVTMTPMQAQLYSQIVEDVRPRIFNSYDSDGMGAARVHILAALLRLRQVCNHPNSIRAFKNLPGLDSGKFNALKELLSEALQCKRKILLYSQFRDMLQIIKSWADEEKVPYCYLDGHSTKRQDIIDEFNNNEEIRLFLISLKAGGTGLNLTAADMVVIYDPWWNPAVEVQAIDRTHRIGQTKKISVYRLVTENSIENKVMELKERKSKLIEALVNDNGLSTLNLTRADLEKLFEPLPSELMNSEEEK